MFRGVAQGYYLFWDHHCEQICMVVMLSPSFFPSVPPKPLSSLLETLTGTRNGTFAIGAKAISMKQYRSNGLPVCGTMIQLDVWTPGSATPP
jgi:hypothetical protein